MSVLISSNTYRFIAPVFEVQDLGLIEVKGKSEPVQVYEVIGAKEHAGSLRGIAGLHSPLVGRTVELQTLLSATADAVNGSGRIVVISGEAGLGKTRLIADWRKRAQAEHANIIWVEGQCLSYRQGLAYHLISDILRNWLGVSDTAAEPEVRAALVEHVNEMLGSAAPETYPYVAHLLSLQLDDSARALVNMLEPQALHSQYVEALRRLLAKLATTHPVVVVLDDIHWIDPSSAELFTRLIPVITRASVLMCFVTRPETDSAGWRLVQSARDNPLVQFNEVVLRPLTENDSRNLVRNLLEIDSLPEQIRTLILKKAEGNPLFVEEVIRMLIDHGTIRHNASGWTTGKTIETVDIPDNLQGLLLARIDRLPDDVKRTLRVASVIGRQFSVNVLEQVLAESENL
jgi:predicted ATPase